MPPGSLFLQSLHILNDVKQNNSGAHEERSHIVEDLASTDANAPPSDLQRRQPTVQTRLPHAQLNYSRLQAIPDWEPGGPRGNIQHSTRGCKPHRIGNPVDHAATVNIKSQPTQRRPHHRPITPYKDKRYLEFPSPRQLAARPVTLHYLVATEHDIVATPTHSAAESLAHR